MKNRGISYAAAALAAFVWLAPTTGRAQTAAETRAALALLSQSETVAYARTRYLRTSEPGDSNKIVDSTLSLRSPFLELIAGIRNLGPKAEKDLEISYNAVLVGAKDFGGPAGLRPGPDGLGMVNSAKCYIAVVEGGAQPNVDRDFVSASYESVDGRQVWTWSVSQFEGSTKSTRFYAAQIGNSYLVVTNNLQDFQETAEILTSAEGSKAASISFPGWESISTHPYWMYRLFRRGEARGADMAGIKDLPADVIALTFFADIDERQGFLQVISSDTTMRSIPKVIRDLDPNRFQPQTAGVWQATIPLSKDEAGVDTMFQVFYRFGFGVAL